MKKVNRKISKCFAVAMVLSQVLTMNGARALESGEVSNATLAPSEMRLNQIFASTPVEVEMRLFENPVVVPAGKDSTELLKVNNINFLSIKLKSSKKFDRVISEKSRRLEVKDYQCTDFGNHAGVNVAFYTEGEISMVFFSIPGTEVSCDNLNVGDVKKVFPLFSVRVSQEKVVEQKQNPQVNDSSSKHLTPETAGVNHSAGSASLVE